MGPGLPEGAETVRKDTEKPSFFVRLATVIVDKRKLIFFLYACALLFCLFSRNWVSVCNDITEYLPVALSSSFLHMSNTLSLAATK